MSSRATGPIRRRTLRGRAILAAAAATVLAITGCGGGSSKQSTTPKRPALVATLSAPTHSPRVGAHWRYSVTAHDGDGRPLRAAVDIRFVFGGAVVGREGTHRFTGRWADTIEWPKQSVGYPLTFRAIVRAANGAGRTLDYTVKVRP